MFYFSGKTSLPSHSAEETTNMDSSSSTKKHSKDIIWRYGDIIVQEAEFSSDDVLCKNPITIPSDNEIELIPSDDDIELIPSDDEIDLKDLSSSKTDNRDEAIYITDEDIVTDKEDGFGDTDVSKMAEEYGAVSDNLPAQCTVSTTETIRSKGNRDLNDMFPEWESYFALEETSRTSIPENIPMSDRETDTNEIGMDEIADSPFIDVEESPPTQVVPVSMPSPDSPLETGTSTAGDPLETGTSTAGDSLETGTSTAGDPLETGTSTAGDPASPLQAATPQPRGRFRSN